MAYLASIMKCGNNTYKQDIASTCLFIATKVEECTRRFKDIVLACARKASKNDNLRLEEDSKEFTRWKESLLHNEIIVLDTLCFDLSVEHPHTSLMKFESQLTGNNKQASCGCHYKGIHRSFLM